MPLAEDLTDSYYPTLIVRLLVDLGGSMLSGELADAEGTTLKRFPDEEGLHEAVRSYLATNIRPAGGGMATLLITSLAAYYRVLPAGQIVFSDNQALLELGARGDVTSGR